MDYRRVFVENSCVHLIIVAYNRSPIFLEHVNLLKKSFKNAKQFFSFEIIAICVLPTHIHLLIKPKRIEDYPKIITSIKYYFSRNFTVGVETPTYGYLNKKEKGLFQRRFYEHTIRTEEELNNHINYIHYNPVKHNLVDKVRDWEFSSFHRFVVDGFYEENWGSLKDIETIKSLDFD